MEKPGGHFWVEINNAGLLSARISPLGNGLTEESPEEDE